MSQHSRGDTSVLGEQNWYRWHAPYDELVSPQTERLAAVQELIRAALDTAGPGSRQAISVCSGQSRDLLPMLISHPRGRDFRVRMIELEPLNASFLHGALGSTDLAQVEVRVGDAGLSDAYAGAVPADLVLISGPFAHIGPADLQRTIATLDQLCAPGAAVVWSLYGPGLARLDDLLAAFTATGFSGTALVPGPDGDHTVGAHRFDGSSAALVPGRRLFTFSE